MDSTLKITSVFSDPTRYSIYQFISEKKREVTVHDIAEKFAIHPNVARFHLTKLEEIRVLTSNYKKTGKGGRPGKIYTSSEEVVELSFPNRDFRLLSDIAIRSLLKLGQDGYKLIIDTGFEYGQEMVKSFMKTRKLSLLSLTIEDKINIIKEVTSSMGIIFEDPASINLSKLSFQYYHCPFKENALTEPSFICGVHNAFLKGAFDLLFEVEEFNQVENMINDCTTCSYHVIVTN